MNWAYEKWFLLCIVLVAFCVLLLLAMVCAMAIGVLIVWKQGRDAMKRLEVMNLLEQDVLPMVKTMHGLLEDTAPKLIDVTNQMILISNMAREQAENVNETVTGVIDLTQAKVKRADEYLTTIMNGVSGSIESLHRATTATSRQVNAVAKGVRAGMGELQRKQR